MNGVRSSFRAGFSVSKSSSLSDSFTSSSTGSISISSQGVVGNADATGVRTGVMTSAVTTPSGTDTVGGQVTMVPATSSTPAATFAQLLSTTSGTTLNKMGMWAQTSDASAQIFTQRVDGSFNMTTSSPYTTGTLDGTGWGRRNGSGSLSQDTTGTISATVTDTGGSTISSGAGIINTTIAGVVSSSGGTMTGPAMGLGSANNNTIFSTSGTVTIPSTNDLTYNYTGTWASPDSKGTLSSGVISQTPGIYFQQTASGTLTANTASGNTQTYSLTGSGSRTGVVPGTFSIVSPSDLTSVAKTSGAFPAAGSAPANVYMRGVVTGTSTSGGSGNMTAIVTATGSNSPVVVYRGPVTINSSGALDATVVGRNYASPGINRVPATQTGTLTQRYPGP
jgi:hypothetical protein